MRAHENPYRVSRVEALGFRGSESVAHLAATVRSHEYRGVIVGPEGSGKSTLLRELAGIIVADGVRVRIARFDDVAALASALVQRDPVWLVDGAERIPAPIRSMLATLVRRIVMTSHEETSTLPLLESGHRHFVFPNEPYPTRLPSPLAKSQMSVPRLMACKASRRIQSASSRS